MCFDGNERLCNIRGKMRKKVWIGVGDIVLIGLRDFQGEEEDSDEDEEDEEEEDDYWSKHGMSNSKGYGN